MPRTGIRKKSQAARQNLLAAALQVIGTKGYKAATMDEIAKQAGVSKGLAYYHFSNKAKLAAAVLDDGLGGLVSSLDAAAAQSGSAADALKHMIDVLAENLYRNRMVTRFVFEEMFRSDRDCSNVMRDYIQRFLGLIEDLIRRGQAEGAFAASLDAGYTAVALFGTVMTTSMYYMGLDVEGQETGHPLPQEDYVKQLRSFALAAVAA